MKFKDIFSFSSPAFRKLLKTVFKEGKFYTVRFGKLKGLKSYYRNDINFYNLLGLYDTDSLEILDKIIKQYGLREKKIVVADIGANMGYYSLYFAKYLSPESRIYAFEPSVSILDVLKKNMSGNHINNVEIVEAACSEKAGTVEFYIGQNHHTSSMLDSWAGNSTTGTLTKVKAVSIDEFFGTDGIGLYPDLIKMDIEGAGVYALKGCEQCLQKKRPFVLIESHTPEEDAAIVNLLRDHQYEAFRINNQKWVLHKDMNYSDPQGVWGTMLLIPAEKKQFFKN